VTTACRGLGCYGPARSLGALAASLDGDDCYLCGQPMHMTDDLRLGRGVDRQYTGALTRRA
jgi:hypothetical protein